MGTRVNTQKQRVIRFTASRGILVLLLILTSMLLAHSSVSADEPQQRFTATALTPVSIIHSDAAKPSGYGNLVSVIVRLDDVRSLGSIEAATLRAVPSARIVHRYEKVFGGVSMVVPRDEISRIRKLPGVTAVIPDRLRQIDTETSPSFIGADE